MKFRLYEFGGNVADSCADTAEEAVVNLVGVCIPRVCEDGYVLVDGEPFGWIEKLE